MMGKHTAGPWKLDYYGEGCFHVSTQLSVADGGHIIATRNPISDELVEEGEANAHLIAAAPELLEAAQSLMGLLDTPLARRIYGEDGFYLAAIESGRTAIAKAKGES